MREHKQVERKDGTKLPLLPHVCVGHCGRQATPDPGLPVCILRRVCAGVPNVACQQSMTVQSSTELGRTELDLIMCSNWASGLLAFGLGFCLTAARHSASALAVNGLSQDNGNG